MNLKHFPSQLLSTVAAFFRAMRFIRANNLTKYYAFPILMAILFWIGGSVLIVKSVESISSWTYGFMELDAQPSDLGFFSSFGEAWETTKSWVNGASTMAVMVVLKIVFWFLMGIITKYVLLIILAPVLAYISEKSESIITGKTYPFDMQQLTRDIWRGILIAFRNMAIEIGLLIVLSIVTIFAPLLSPITAIVGLVMGAYFYGYSMLDYISERKKLSIAESNQFVSNHAGIAVGLGFFITFAIMIPIIGFLTASFASIIATVAAVILIYGDNKQYNYRVKNGVVTLKDEI